jgi:acetolactate synthase small subunit
VFCFSVLAAAEPGVMPRVLELFAKRGLVPRRWVSDVSGPGGRDLSIDVQVAGLTPKTHAYMARCLRQIWGVHTVLTSAKGRELTGRFRSFRHPRARREGPGDPAVTGGGMKARAEP